MESRTGGLQTKILFVCHGNICRSVMAEFIMKHLAIQAGRENDFYIESCATSTEEIGNDIYPPAKHCLTSHNIPFATHSARQITKEDYERFDLIICMEQYNIRNLLPVLGHDILTADAQLPQPKICLLLSRDVADPWYTGNFEATYQDLKKGCSNLLKL